MPNFRDLDELEAAVPPEEPLAVTARDLRDAAGALRLGALVRERIADDLSNRGLGFFPPGELPDRQEQTVYVYRRASSVGKLIGAIIMPSETGLRLLKQAAAPAGQLTREEDSLQEALAAIEDARTLLQRTIHGEGESGEGQQETG